MSAFNYYTGAFKKYAEFKGRARRSEYWYFVLFNVIAAFVAMGIDMMIGMPVFYLIYVLGAFIPGLAVAVRRLHDTGKSGWMLLLALIPLVNFVLLYFMCVDSQPGTNQYGPNPKEVLAGDDIARHLVQD